MSKNNDMLGSASDPQRNDRGGKGRETKQNKKGTSQQASISLQGYRSCCDTKKYNKLS